ncbi:MAG TPA: O-antigen ligase family protein [Gemmatimonadales bacterium]|nr:O-antigen ligase family protein [Gemmatimonadales bacterium]
MVERWGSPGAVAEWGTTPSPGVSTPTRSGGSWDLLLVCPAVYVATAVGRIHELFPILGYLKPALVATALGLGLYALQQRGLRNVGRLRSAATSCLLGLLLWGALSVPGALNQGLAFQSWTNYVQTALLCLLVAGSVRNPKDVERLCLVYFGVTVVYTAVVLSRFELGADNWRLSRLYYYDANDFATLIVTAMPLGLYFALSRHRVSLRLLALAGLGLLAIGLIRSGSRGGFLAFLALVAFVLLRVTTIPARMRLAGLVLIVAITFGAASDQYWTQMQTIISPKRDYNLTSEEGRVRIWERGIGYMTGNPVFGVGLRNFQVAEGTISAQARRAERGLGVRWGAAHNSFVQIGAELGVPGLLLFVALFVSAFRSLARAARRFRSGDYGPEASRLAQTLMASLVGFVVGGFFLSLAYADLLYTLVAFSIGMDKIARFSRP